MKNKLKFALIYGSTRKKRLGIRFVNYLANQILKSKHVPMIIDPLENKLPLLDKRFEDELKRFVEEYIDIVFCNFDEAKMFCQCESMADVSAYLQNFSKKIVMTAGPEGAYYFEGETVVHEVALKVDNVIDTTGAGDNFAAGFLDFYLSDKSIQEALTQGNSRASQVIQQLGPRIKRH